MSDLQSPYFLDNPFFSTKRNNTTQRRIRIGNVTIFKTPIFFDILSPVDASTTYVIIHVTENQISLFSYNFLIISHNLRRIL